MPSKTAISEGGWSQTLTTSRLCFDAQAALPQGPKTASSVDRRAYRRNIPTMGAPSVHVWHIHLLCRDKLGWREGFGNARLVAVKPDSETRWSSVRFPSGRTALLNFG